MNDLTKTLEAAVARHARTFLPAPALFVPGYIYATCVWLNLTWPFGFESSSLRVLQRSGQDKKCRQLGKSPRAKVLLLRSFVSGELVFINYESLLRPITPI